TGKAFAIMTQDTDVLPTVVEYKLTIFETLTFVLWDSRFTHSFVSLKFVQYLLSPPMIMDFSLVISTLAGSSLVINIVYPK
ncbi:hypothetical protein, partial [Halomonas sp. ND22Bw]|uniref:hypothetical protein n=1 Tax=Halomonas sp. ND22Bw TaxID=2054178 RepID=UPI0015E6A37D